MTTLSTFADAGDDPAQINMRWRVDSAPARREIWQASTNYLGAFAPEPIAFARSIAHGRILRMEFTPSGEGPVIATFVLGDADSAVTQVSRACKWPRK